MSLRGLFTTHVLLLLSSSAQVLSSTAESIATILVTRSRVLSLAVVEAQKAAIAYIAIPLHLAVATVQ